MPEYDPAAAYEALAPLHWDAEEFNFGIASEDDESQTEGEDLHPVPGGVGEQQRRKLLLGWS